MALLDATGNKSNATLDTFIYKQLLHGAGLDKNMQGMAGMVFTDVIAEAIAKTGPSLLPHAQTKGGNVAPAASAPSAPGVTSGFGARLDPITHQPSIHPGIDVHASAGEPITAAWGGTVVSAGDRGGYGQAVEVDHGNGVHTLYAHAQALHVKAGDTVEAGDVIADVGSSGHSTGPHLHLELRVDGRPVDPTSALKAYRDRADINLRGQNHEGP